MSIDTALIEKREELKRRLAAGEYKTLVDVFLARTDHLIRKVTRRSKPLSIWVITIILTIILVLIGFAAVYSIDNLLLILNLFKSYGVLGIPITILSVFLAIASVVVINQYVGRIFVFWSENVFDVIQSVESLDDFQDWLGKVCNRPLHLLVTIIGGFLGGLYLVYLINALLGVFIGYGSTFTIILVSMFSAAFVHLFFGVVLLSARLRQYELKLFGADPSNSEIVSRLSSELNFVIYFVAFYAAILTLISAWSKILPSFGIFLVLFLWLPIIAMFVLNHSSLSSIIRRGKWKTLNEIQTKVEKLQAAKNFTDKETMDAINRLMDYHDRVIATPNSAIKLNTTLGFINSLLLPLLAFLLGNLDLVFRLFARQP